MPRTQPNPNRAFTGDFTKHGDRLDALEKQQYMVFTDPNTVNGTYPQGIPVVVVGDLSVICGINAYGIAVYNETTTTWTQLQNPIPSPASTVTGPDSFGASAHVGTSTAFARADHDHGLPAGGGSGPASLSGAGETSTPGALTQTGPFTVTDTSSGGFSVSTAGPAQIATTALSAAITISAALSGVSVSAGNGNTLFLSGGAGLVEIYSTGLGISLVASKIGFFGTTPATRIAGSTITTLAQLVTALQTYGLLS